MNEKKLLKYAVDYLSKYDSSKRNLLDVLKRKIFRLNLNKVEKNILFNDLNIEITDMEGEENYTEKDKNASIGYWDNRKKFHMY